MGSFWKKITEKRKSDSEKTAPVITRSEKNGGIVKINCARNGKYLLQSVSSIALFQIVVDTAKRTRSIPIDVLREDWDRFGPESFYLEVLKVVPRQKDLSTEGYDDLLQAALREVSESEDPALSY